MIKRISHITFFVSDLKKSVIFYEKILGLKKTGEWSNYAVFDVDGVDLALAPGGKKGRKEGAPDIYMSVDDVDEAYKNLKEKSVKSVTEPENQYWGGRTVGFLDPDENMVILVSSKK